MASITQNVQPYWAIEFNNAPDKLYSKRSTDLPVKEEIQAISDEVISMLGGDDGKIKAYNVIQGISGVTSMLPGGIGLKIAMIKYIDTTFGASTVLIEFKNLTKDEVDLPFFNQLGQSIRLYLGWYGWFGIGKDKKAFAVFEGTLQTVDYKYEADGCTAVAEFASYQATRAHHHSPGISLLDFYGEWEDKGFTLKGEPKPIQTVAHLLYGLAKFMKCRDIRIFFPMESKVVEDSILDILGFTTTAEALDKASQSWNSVKQYLNQAGSMKVKNGKSVESGISYLTPVEILNALAGFIKCNWWISGMGILYFGVQPAPLQSECCKVFQYRPTPKGFYNGGLAEPISFDSFESFTVQEELEYPFTKSILSFSTGSQEFKSKLTQQLEAQEISEEATQLILDKVSSVVDLMVTDSEVGKILIEAAKQDILAKNLIAEDKLKALDLEGYVNKAFDSVYDSNLADMADACKTTNSSLRQILASIDGVPGDPAVQGGSTIYVSVAKKHSGFYFVSEVEHIIKVNDYYKMQITGNLPKKSSEYSDSNVFSEAVGLKSRLQQERELLGGGIKTTSSWKGITFIGLKSLEQKISVSARILGILEVSANIGGV